MLCIECGAHWEAWEKREISTKNTSIKQWLVTWKFRHEYSVEWCKNEICTSPRPGGIFTASCKPIDTLLWYFQSQRSSIGIVKSRSTLNPQLSTVLQVAVIKQTAFKLGPRNNSKKKDRKPCSNSPVVYRFWSFFVFVFWSQLKRQPALWVHTTTWIAFAFLLNCLHANQMVAGEVAFTAFKASKD
jgi:hypothetical protein